MAEGEAPQAYRWIFHRGRDLDKAQKIGLRSKVLNPEVAKGVGDVEAKIAQWKADISRLTSIDPAAVADGDRVQPLWSLLPEGVQDNLMSRGFNSSDWSNYDS